MPPRTAAKSTLGTCGVLPIEAELAEGGGAGRAALVARLTEDLERLGDAPSNASPAERKERVLLVECLRAARQVLERSASFVEARGEQ